MCSQTMVTMLHIQAVSFISVRRREEICGREDSRVRWLDGGGGGEGGCVRRMRGRATQCTLQDG